MHARKSLCFNGSRTGIPACRLCNGRKERTDKNVCPTVHGRAKIEIRTRNSGSVRERPPAGFFAAQRRSLERRAAGAARKARDAVRMGGDLPPRRYKK